MTIRGDYWFPSRPAELWAALVSPDALKRCLPGCVRLDRLSETEFALEFAVKNRALEGTIETRARLESVAPQSKAELSGEAGGEAIGPHRWTGALSLEADSSGCLLKYSLSIDGTDATNGNQIERAARELIEAGLVALSHEVSISGDLQHVAPIEGNLSGPAGTARVTELARRSPRKHTRSWQLWLWAAVFALIGLRLLSYFQN